MGTDFIVNTAGHKRWYLPDGLHIYSTTIYGTFEQICVYDSRTMRTRLSHSLKLTDPNWRDLSNLAQEMANKRFAKPLRYEPKRRVR